MPQQERRRRSAEPSGQFDVLSICGVPHRGPPVLDLALEPHRSGVSVASHPRCEPGVGDRCDPCGSSGGGLVATTVFTELGQREFAQGVEQAKPRGARDGLGHDHALVDQPDQCRHGLPAVEAGASHQVLERVELESTGEHPERTEHGLLGCGQQPVRPVDHRPQVPALRGAPAAPVGEQREPVVEAVDHRS